MDRSYTAAPTRALVLPDEVGRYRYYLSTRFATYARRAGLPHIDGPHGLRHPLASALDASDSGLATISALLGHASTAVTSKVYTHMLKGADRAAVDSHAATLLGDLAARGRTVPPIAAEALPADQRPVADPGMTEDTGVA